MLPVRDDVPAISIRDLSKSYGSIEAVRGISLDVARGEVFGFLGLNGAGKTTTIRILLDLLRPTRGSAQLFGFDCQSQSIEARTLVGYLPGELGLYPDMTGDELLSLTAQLSGANVDVDYRTRLIDRLEFAHADLKRQLREYSTGMKRKLGLLQALQADPPLVILDEPTEGLDPLVQTALHEILFELRKNGRTVFMSSHVLSEVERVCDRIAVIRKGRIVLLSTVEEARRRTGRIVKVFLKDGTQQTIRIEGEIGELLPKLAAMPVRDLEIIEPALEDVLRSFYREES